MNQNPLAIELFAGLHGWAEGLVAEGWRVVGFDLYDMCGELGVARPDGDILLVLQDVLTLCGSQFRHADLIVASPPCTEFSYMAMPWQRAKQIAAALRGDGQFPAEYSGSRTQQQLTALFRACFQLQLEACAAAGRHIPLIVENVKGAQPWVGRARAHYGSFYLWGDVPALLPIPMRAFKSTGMNWSDQSKRGQDFTRVAGNQAIKNAGGSWYIEKHGSKSNKRKFASAMIAKIPFELSRYIARIYKPLKAVA